MNHRTLFFLSLIVIIVGLLGIFLQNQSSDITNQTEALVENKPIKRTRLVAQATRDLRAYETLSPSDYQIKEIEIEEGRQSEYFPPEFSLTTLKGYLILHNIAEGSKLLPEMLDSPLSPTFIKNSLKSNKLPYSIKVKADDAWLLSFLTVGDNVTLYLRLEEKKSRILKSNEGQEDSYLPDGIRTGSSFTRFLGPVKVIDLQKSADPGYSSKSPDETVGEIIIRLSQSEMKKLRVVEKSAEILVSPSSNEDDFNNNTLSLGEVLPQLTPSLSIRELRGNK